MNNAEYEGQIRGWDFGPDTGHYHAFVEFDGYMVPWTGEYADGLCWTTRSIAAAMAMGLAKMRSHSEKTSSPTALN